MEVLVSAVLGQPANATSMHPSPTGPAPCHLPPCNCSLSSFLFGRSASMRKHLRERCRAESRPPLVPGMGHQELQS